MNRLYFLFLSLSLSWLPALAQSGGVNVPAEQIPCDQLETHPAFLEHDYLPETVAPLPATLEEAIVSLDTLLNDYQKRYLLCQPESQARENLHHGLGTWLRHAFGLWGASPLRMHMLERGVIHPDDMSSIILISYYRKLRGAPMEIQQQIDYFQNYWRAKGVNVDSLIRVSLEGNR